MKNLLLYIFLFIYFTFANAQQWQWADITVDCQNPANGGTYPNDITVDKNGNSYALITYTGDTLIVDSFTMVNSYLIKYGYKADINVLVKYNAQGKVQWIKDLYLYGSWHGVRICCDKDGNIYLTSHYEGASYTLDSLTVTNSSYTALYQADIFVAKLDTNGKAVWLVNSAGLAQVVCSDTYQEHSDIAISPSGKLYLLGQHRASIKWGTTTLYNPSSVYPNCSSNAYLVQFNANNGNVNWAKSYGGSSEDEFKTISFDKDNNCYLAGYSSSTDFTFDTTTFLIDGMDGILLKVDSLGNSLYGLNYSGSEFNGSWGVVLANVFADNMGATYVLGTFYDSLYLPNDTIFAENATYSSFFLLKLTNSNQIEWVKHADFDSSGSAGFLGTLLSGQIDDSGNMIVCVSFTGTAMLVDNIVIPNSSNYYSYEDLSILSFDTNGNIKWIKSVTGKQSEEIINSSINNNKLYILLDVYNVDSVNFDTICLIGISSYNSIVAVLDISTEGTASSIKLVADKENEIVCYPNPTNGILNITFQSPQNSSRTITLFDVAGKLIYQDVVHENKAQISVSNLQEGTYFVQAKSDSNYYYNKINIVKY